MSHLIWQLWHSEAKITHHFHDSPVHKGMVVDASGAFQGLRWRNSRPLIRLSFDFYEAFLCTIIQCLSPHSSIVIPSTTINFNQLHLVFIGVFHVSMFFFPLIRFIKLHFQPGTWTKLSAPIRWRWFLTSICPFSCALASHGWLPSKNPQKSKGSNLTLACPSAIFRTRAWVWACRRCRQKKYSWGKVDSEIMLATHVKSQLWASLDLWSSSHLRLKKEKQNILLCKKKLTPLTGWPLVGNEGMNPQYQCKGWFPHSLLRASQKKTLTPLINLNLQTSTKFLMLCEPLQLAPGLVLHLKCPRLSDQKVSGGRFFRIQNSCEKSPFPMPVML